MECGYYRKKKFNVFWPLKLKTKKCWGKKKKNFADLQTLFQNKGEIRNKIFFLGLLYIAHFKVLKVTCGTFKNITQSKFLKAVATLLLKAKTSNKNLWISVLVHVVQCHFDTGPPTEISLSNLSPNIAHKKCFQLIIMGYFAMLSNREDFKT